MQNDLKPKITLIMLLTVNLLPLLGVYLLGWNVFVLIFLYWLENVITGFFNILRMLVLQPWHILHWFGKLFTVGFFTFHYGMFTAVHGVFVIMLFGGESITNRGTISPSIIFDIISKYQLIYIVLALYLSHGLSYLINYIGGKEYQKTNLKILMGRPYGRIIILHIVVLIGGFFVLALKSPKLGIVLLVFLKTFFDLAAHRKEHVKNKKQLKTD
jgi:hypothetical protein